MFAVIYRFTLTPSQEPIYQQCWHSLVTYFIEKRGAIGSCLHKADDGSWVAYSRWPDKATRDAAWPGNNAPSADFPQEVLNSIHTIQAIMQDNKNLENQHEICLEVVEDLLTKN